MNPAMSSAMNNMMNIKRAADYKVLNPVLNNIEDKRDAEYGKFCSLLLLSIYLLYCEIYLIY